MPIRASYGDITPFNVVPHLLSRFLNPLGQPGLVLDFGESSLPKEWKERTTQSLNNYADVFPRHDLDFGHTSKVEHHINMRNDMTFKLRSGQYTLTIMKL